MSLVGYEIANALAVSTSGTLTSQPKVVCDRCDFRLEAYPHMAQRLETMGYEYLRAPKRIQGSYFPPDECTSFSLDLKRLRKSDISWLTRQRIALLHLHRRIVNRKGL